MAKGVLAPSPKFTAVDANGNPRVGAKLFTYATGTTTKTSTYSDSGLTSANANPIVLDSAGQATIYLNPAITYKFVLAPSTDSDPPVAAYWTVDPVQPPLISPRQVAVMTTAVTTTAADEETLFDYVAAAGELSNDGMGWEGEFFGRTTNVAGTKTLFVRMLEGATNAALLTFVLTASEVGRFVVRFRIIRLSATSWISHAECIVGPDNGPASRTGTLNVVSSGGNVITFANAVTVRVSADSNTTSIQLLGGSLKLVPLGT